MKGISNHVVPWVLLLMGAFVLPIERSMAKDFVFAVVPKKASSPFYKEAGRGCQDAAQTLKGVNCVFQGAMKTNDVRRQDMIISGLIAEGVDGIALAVTQSEFLASRSIYQAVKAGIPVVAFDADFALKDQHLREAYIGTNNLALGRALGEAAKKLRPNGGSICIHTGRLDSPNLNLRIMGIRSALSGVEYNQPPGKRLNGENGWREWSRCPLPHRGDFDRAISQMQLVFEKPEEVNTLIGVGGGPQNAFLKYQKLMRANKKGLDTGRLKVIFADTNAYQLKHLEAGLSHYNVGQNPYEMGKQAIITLHKIVTQQAYEKIQFTPLTHCDTKNYQKCTLEK
jgi:ribose transport system substrate-binding protein